ANGKEQKVNVKETTQSKQSINPNDSKTAAKTQTPQSTNKDAKPIAKDKPTNTNIKSTQSPKPTKKVIKVVSKTVENKTPQITKASNMKKEDVKAEKETKDSKESTENAKEVTSKDQKMEDSNIKEATIKDGQKEVATTKNEANIKEETIGKVKEATKLQDAIIKETETATKIEEKDVKDTKETKVTSDVSSTKEVTKVELSKKETKVESSKEQTNSEQANDTKQSVTDTTEEDKSEVAITPRITRSRLENIKSNEESKEGKTERTQSPKAKNLRKLEKEHVDKAQVKEENKTSKAKATKQEEEEQKSTSEVLESEKEEKHFEPRKTRSHGEQKTEVDKEKTESSASKEDLTKQKEDKDHKETKETQAEVTEENDATLDETKTQTDEEQFEPRKTRKRGEVKAELEKETNATPAEIIEEKAATLDESKHKQMKNNEEHLEPRKTRKRVEHNETKNITQSEVSKEKISSQDDSKILTDEEHFEPRTTRKRVAQKDEQVKETTKTTQIESSEEKLSQQEQTKEETLEPRKTRSRAEIKETAEKETTAEVKEQAENKTTEKIAAAIQEEKDNSAKQTEKPTNHDDNKTQTDEEHAEPRKTRSRADIKATQAVNPENELKEGKETTKISSVEPSTEKTSTQDAAKPEKDTPETSTVESKIKQKLSNADEKTEISQSEDITSNVDKKPAEESQLENEDVIAEQAESSMFDTLSKSQQDSISLDADMSGSECSSITSSNSDNTIRRTLRKRATETPLSENGEDLISYKKKKLFKEPPPLKTTPTPVAAQKIGKFDKPTVIGSTTIKRVLRSPALEENQSSGKKPKLDNTSKKSTRFRNLNDDCLVEEELPVVTADVVTKEQDYLHEPQEEPLNNTGVQEKNTEEKPRNAKGKFAPIKEPEKVLQKEVLGSKQTTKTTNKVALQVIKQQSVNKDPLSIKSNVNIKKSLPTEAKAVISNVSKVQETPERVKGNKTNINVSPTKTPGGGSTTVLTDKTKTIKGKVNVSPTKSPGSSAVMSFSDWLKSKKQNVEVESTETTSTTKDTTQATSVNPIKVKDKPVTKTSEIKPTEDKDEKEEVAEITTKEDNNMMCQNKEKELQPAARRPGRPPKVKPAAKISETKPAEDKDKTLEMADTTTQADNKILSQIKEKDLQSTVQPQQDSKATDDKETSENITDTTQQLDNSLLQPSDNQLQNVLQQQSRKSSSKKAVKRLSNSIRKSTQKRASPIVMGKSNTPKVSPPKLKPKKREIDLLIESMSKEMKEGGINDLLNTPTHVKRQRLSVKRNVNDSMEQLNTSQEPSMANVTAEIPKVMEFSENSDTSTTTNTPTTKDINKSPTKRKTQQIAAKTKRSSLLPRDMLKTPDIMANTEQRMFSTPPSKVLSTKSRKSLNIKELAGTEAAKTTEIVAATESVAKSRKSMPLLTPKDSMDKVVIASARKSLVIPKQQPAIQASNVVFKTPKQPAAGHPSTLLNLIPSADNIKKLYVDDHNKRLKITPTASTLKTYKCRKLRVRLNRSMQQPQRVLPVIQNNSETNLRIQSVVDAGTLLSATPTSSTADVHEPAALIDQTQPHMIPNTNTLLTPMPVIEPVQQPYILPTTTRAPSTVAPLTTTTLINVPDTNETIELKNEFVDENPMGLINDAILPDTPTLLARAQTITEAAQHALSSSVTPTDIRLLTTDSSSSNYVPSFGVTPTALDNRGTCMYTFLHPAKYNRNHSNVLLDYCCPNLDGPMPAIDPTRIHAQVQVPIIELPASIVLTTKVVTRADLESGNSSIPAIIRKKAEKIRKNLATHHKMATAATTITAPPPAVIPTMAPTPRPALTATINALTKQLPPTTTITAKIRHSLPAESQILPTQPPAPTPQAAPSAATLPRNIISIMPKGAGHMTAMSNVQNSSLRCNLRRFDVLLKQLVQPFESLSFVDRHRIIEALIGTGKFSAKDLDQTLVLMEEYIKQTLLLQNETLDHPTQPPTSAILNTNSYITTQPAIAAANTLSAGPMPQLQPSPTILASSQHHKAVRKVQTSRNRNTTLTTTATSAAGAGAGSSVMVKQRQVPIYDTDRNIIGYQMQMMTPLSTIPAYTKSTMSTHTGAIMSTSMDSSNNKITTTTYSVNKRPIKRPAQESPRVFYTTPPLKTSTPKALTNPHQYPTAATSTQHGKNTNTIAKKTQGSIVTTVRSGGSSASGSSETITTTTMATVKRVTRSTATGSKIIIVSKSNQSSEETILPDSNNQQLPTEPHAEIKNEDDIEDYLA
ncbi:uncharacterized protein LOC119615211, partial [Lucilia sericata]|uniref:uncharacterized protein LOC119615211 n=1 Tax=Lucilia sericata TaxID=13632 RepID=UPI0018A8062E